MVAFVDKDPQKRGLFIEGIPVIRPEEICNYEYETLYISTVRYYDEICYELRMLGIDMNHVELLEFSSNKYGGELAFWKNRFRNENNDFKNDHYKQLFLEIADEQNDDFMTHKIVADFGCGPRGSLAWTDKPLIKIGIDVLINSYMKHFGNCMIKHGMIYVNCDERIIPLPSGCCDIMSTINSLDHVENLNRMIEEIARVMKSGGIFWGGINLNEPATLEEPQTLTESFLTKELSKYFSIIKKEMAPEWFCIENSEKLWIKAVRLG